MNQISSNDKANKPQSKISVKRIKGLQISIASPDVMRSWSHGEVTKPETINYKSLKPEPDGLFDEAIFGPVKDYECACGKYKKIKHQGKVCEKCSVEITESIVRRERMGHIELAAPVAHTWMVKELPSPSKISLVLDISYKEVEQVVYFISYIVLDPGNGEVFKFKEIVDLSGKGSKNARGKLRKVLREIFMRLKKGSPDYERARTYYQRLYNSNLPFSIDEVSAFIRKHAGVRLGIGAEAILELLDKIDLEAEYKKNNAELKNPNNTQQRTKRILRLLETIKWFKESGVHPRNMILRIVPVTPPDTRPIIQLDGARFTTSDINNFYRRIIIRNERLKKVIELKAPSIILNNEKRMLQEVVDALFDNASRKKPIAAKDKRPLKSLTDRLKGKQGLFRQNLLGKRVDYSGRSVIIVGPELKMYEVGIPAIMILKLFRPFIIRELIRRHDDNGIEIKPIASNIKIAEQMIRDQSDHIWDIVNKIIKERPVLLNRAPTLHRLSIQAFEPKVIEGKAIRLHPLVTTAFNADFDGDQMAVHIPISREAVAEARAIMLASLHILGPKDGKPIVTPTQDMVLGIYYLTTETRGAKGEGTIFGSVQELLNAYENGNVHVHALVGISTTAFPRKVFPNHGILITTVGKAILNSIMPDNMVYLDNPESFKQIDGARLVKRGKNPREVIKEVKAYRAFDKKALAKIIDLLYKNYPLSTVARTLDTIKNLGFRYSTSSSTTVSIFDIPQYNKKWEYFKVVDEQVAQLKRQYQKGLLTDNERYTRVVKLWTEIKDRVSADIVSLIGEERFRDNSIVVMAASGARGNISNFTQLFGMRGLMSKSFNYDQKQQNKIAHDTIEVPIKHSFIEGLTINEYFNSSYGARKGMTDTAMKTSKSGYMTRKLVDATQEVVVREVDCGANRGIVVTQIRDSQTGGVYENIADRIAHRFVAEPILHPKTHAVLAEKNTMVSPELAAEIMEAGVTVATVRSPLYCQTLKGLCQTCFGNDLTTNEPVALGTAVGVIAAQSIGEPGTQLTMRTFQTGGVSTETNLAQGFERLKQIFDVVTPKEWERATIAEAAGVVSEISEDGEHRTIVVSANNDAQTYETRLNASLAVKKGSRVAAGDKLTEGSIDIKALLRVSGIDAVRTYMIAEVQKVYRIQGIEISDKYVETIVRQLTNKMQITDPGDTSYFTGQIVDVNHLRQENAAMMAIDKQPALAISQVFGLDDVPSKTGSFLSAASFQDTKKILTDAAVRGQIDYLEGLKENVILGNLIPAGTGFMTSEEIIQMGEDAQEFEY